MAPPNNYSVQIIYAALTPILIVRKTGRRERLLESRTRGLEPGAWFSHPSLRFRVYLTLKRAKRAHRLFMLKRPQPRHPYLIQTWAVNRCLFR